MDADWTGERWHAEVTAWLDERLAAAGRSRTGPVTQPRVRRWGTVLTAPTTGGTVWVKATASTTAHEVALYACFATAVPEHVPLPIGLDADRGLLALPDHAPDLGDPGDVLPAAVLVRYGQLQRAVAPHVDGLVAAGVPDMRPAVLPERFDEAVDALVGFAARHGGAADVALVDAVRARRAEFAGLCRQLADSPVPASVDHNDLHARNVLIGGGAVRFFDWGDTVIAHPFTSLLVPLGQAGAQAPRLRAAYLGVFADLATEARLVADAELAVRVAVVARTHTWIRAVGVDGEDERFARAPLESLAALVESPVALSGRSSGTTVG